MKMKKSIFFALALALSVSAFAQEASNASHFKFYGFIRNYFAFDTRESSAGTADLYYYMPKDESFVNSEDINATPSFRFVALTTRAGVDVTGYEVAGYKIGAKIEADFYAGLSGSTGTAQFRLRQAYVTLAKGARNWKIGQAWHPMAADLPDIFSLESGVPFGPFSRTPMVSLDLGMGKGWSLNAAALWQMQYTSTGPDGASANYIRNSCIPELYLGISYKGQNGGAFRIGADYLNIKPYKNDALGGVASSRRGSWIFFEYGQFKLGDFTFKEKVTFAEDGSHMNMIGGYGVSKLESNGEFVFSSTRTLSGWGTIQYKAKNSSWVPSLFLGYARNFGTKDPIVADFWGKNSVQNVKDMYRIQPELLYNLGKVQFGLEYMFTSVRYGQSGNMKVPAENLHWISNHRIQAMVKYTF